MEITQVSCNGCGAALQVTSGARFVTCKFCGASLEIKQTDSAVFTEVLARVDQRTAEMAEDLGAIRRETEIERLDREWALRRESLIVRGKHGSVSQLAAGLITLFTGGGFGLLLTIKASSLGAPGFFPIFGILWIAIAIFSGLRLIAGAQRYQAEQADYERRRAALLARNRENESQPEPQRF